MKNISEKAFTLVELLIVIGIIGILAVTLMISLNPAEAQKKARDAKRIKDASTIESIIVQLINDNITIPSTALALGNRTTGANSKSALTAQSQPCAPGSNWLLLDVCTYAKTVPTDPLNTKTADVVTTAAGAVAQRELFYSARISGVDYEINVRQESKSNAAKVNGDGGTDPGAYELFTGSPDLLLSSST